MGNKVKSLQMQVNVYDFHAQLGLTSSQSDRKQKLDGNVQKLQII